MVSLSPAHARRFVSIPLGARPMSLRLWVLSSAAALGSGLLISLGYPGYPGGSLAWVCLVPWLLALRGHSLAGRLWLGLLCSVVSNLLIKMMPFYGAALTISPNVPVAMLSNALILISYMFPYILFSALHGRFESITLRDSLILASWLTLGMVLTPVLFTFSPATFLYRQPVFLQVLEFSGFSLLLWVIVLVNLLVRNLLLMAWQRWIRGETGAPWRLHAGVLVLTVGLVVGHGYWRLADADTASAGTLRVATVQANLGGRLTQMALLRDGPQRPGYSYVELTRAALEEAGPVDLVIWPENGITVECDHPALARRLSTFVADIATPLMYQCTACEATAGGEGERCHNQSRYMDATGTARFRYNKQHLIPFFEWLPDATWATLVAPHLQNELLFQKGESSQLFHHGQTAIIPAICYDAHDMALLRRGTALGGELLAVQSNNRIFGLTKIGLSDLAINIISSASLGLPMVKVSNAGYGGVVDGYGRILPDSISPLYERHFDVYDLPLVGRETLFRRYGDWFAWVVAVVAIGGLVIQEKRARR